MPPPPGSLEDLFKSKAKKKAKPVNLNAERPAEVPKVTPVVRKAPAEGFGVSAGETWEKEIRRDRELLKACGLWIKDVEADGACLFRAFADQLGGDPEEHAAFREGCVDFMEANRGDFEPFLEEEFEQYCAQMRLPTTWGGHVEVQALARCHGVNAIIYRPSEAGGPEGLAGTAVENLTADEEETRCVQLSYHPTHHAGQHYNSVRCSEDEGAGPAATMGLAELKRRVQEKLQGGA